MSAITRHRRARGYASTLGGLALALLAAFPSSGSAAPPLVLPVVSATFEAEKRIRIPQPINVTFQVRSSPNADSRQTPLVCLSLLVATRRARKFENKARAEFVMEVQRDGDVVQRLEPTIPFRAGGSLAVADSCEDPLDLLAARRLEIELGDTVAIEARIKGIPRFKKGERVELGNLAAFQLVNTAARLPRREQAGPSAAGGLELRGASIDLHIIGTTEPAEPGPRSARAGLVVPGILPNARLCVDLFAFPLHHPDTRVVANVIVRRTDGNRARSRLRLQFENGQLFAIQCTRRTRSYDDGDAVEVNYRLNDLLVELPRGGRAELGLSILAVEPD